MYTPSLESKLMRVVAHIPTHSTLVQLRRLTDDNLIMITCLIFALQKFEGRYLDFNYQF